MTAYIENSVDTNGRLIDEKPSYYKIINSKVALQLYEKVVAGWLKQWVLVPEGKIVRGYDANHMLNSTIYEVELPDVQVKDYAANIITANMLS